MADKLSVLMVSQASGEEWEACMAIYRAAFPEWERESENIIAARVNAGSYLLLAGRLEQQVIGFYMLELNASFNYVMFNYLAVDETQRGKGLGTLLCRDAMARFRQLSAYSWLFIEAEERQAIFYGRLGFLKLLLDYQSPRFDGPQSVAMHLMVLSREEEVRSIAQNVLRRIIQNIFSNGYLLSDSDPRTASQLARIEGAVDIIAWPKQGNA